MRIKKMTADLYKRHWFWITFRDAVVVVCCFTRETSSLRAFPAIVKSWQRVWAKREIIMRRRRVTDEYIASWFQEAPAARPAPKPTPARVQSRLRTARG
jgi:hypothetical protein